MIAVFSCNTPLENDALKIVLEETNWCPNISQDNEFLNEKMKDILNFSMKSQLFLIESTLIYTIFDSETRTWGIIYRPNKHFISFSLQNPNSDNLKKACEKLVKALENKYSNNFTNVEVFEPTSKDYTFSGDILHTDYFDLTISQRKTEFFVGLLAGICAIFLLSITSPIISPFFLSEPNLWSVWLLSALERLNAAALITVTISWFEIILHWLDIKRQPIIRWTPTSEYICQYKAT